MSILGIDYGAKKIGLATSDEKGKMAFPLDILRNTGKKEVLSSLEKVFATHNIKKIVVGMPFSLSKEKQDNFLRKKDLNNKQMKEVLSFIKWLKSEINIPVEMEDERLSTKMANGLRKDLVKKGPNDAVAAMLILQTYLDKN